MAYQPTVTPHPELPGASILGFGDGSSMTVPTGSLPQELSLANSGATAQNEALDVSNLRLDAAQAAPTSYLPAQPKAQAQQQQQVAPQVQQQQVQATGQQPTITARYSDGKGGQIVQYSDGTSEVVAARGGHAAFNPTRYNASLAPVATGRNVTTTGKQAFDPNRMQEVYAKEQEAALAKANAGVAEANAEALRQQSALEEQRVLNEQQAAELATQEQAYTSKRSGLEEQAKQVATREVNPDRVFSSMKPWQRIGLILASGLSGYANSGRANPVLDRLNSEIDQDVRLQEQQIQREKGAVDNALSRLSQDLGSIEAGKAALRFQQREAAKQKVAAQAALVGTDTANMRAAAMLKEVDAAQARDAEIMRVAAAGQATETTSYAMMAPRAASGGGISRRPTTMAEAEGLRKLGGSAEVDPKMVAEYGQRRTDTEAADAAVQKFAADNNIKTDSKGNLVAPSELPGFGVAASKAPEWALSKQGVVNRAAVEQVVFAQVKAAFGAANDKQVEMITDKVIGNGSPTHIIEQLNTLKRDLAAQRDNIDASYAPQVRYKYEQNKNVARGDKVKTVAGFKPLESK